MLHPHFLYCILYYINTILLINSHLNFLNYSAYFSICPNHLSPMPMNLINQIYCLKFYLNQPHCYLNVLLETSLIQILFHSYHLIKSIHSLVFLEGIWNRMLHLHVKLLFFLLTILLKDDELHRNCNLKEVKLIFSINHQYFSHFPLNWEFPLLFLIKLLL